MDISRITSFLLPLFKKWWCSLLLLPFIIYSLHQAYWALRFNIFFSITYETPFPVNFIHFMLDNFLLIVHEAGHTFFSVFGIRTITILGGSLFEILLPVIIFVFFWFNKKKIGIQLSLYMVGFAFLQVAFYAADGGARQLPLIGGLSKESHDWYNLLSGWGMLESDMTIGVLLVITGGLCYLAALSVPLFFKKYESVSLDLEV
ncbi:hypothetical protein G3570_07710 [Balneolaceae bacterium YR4-1]|uniref:Uncharacterized protein n=1 Tax=Halalkalibaculum roseum TaxID=2709311 RepID=A0A6M1SZA8_9BACT|nr:hypothetical protein [Halalkalibaculum roseum]